MKIVGQRPAWSSGLSTRAQRFLQRQLERGPLSSSSSSSSPASSSSSSSSPAPPAPSSAPTRAELLEQLGSRKDTRRALQRSFHDQVQAELQRDGRRIAKLRSQLSLSGAPRLIPLAVVVMCRTIIADPTGKAGRIYLRRCSNRVFAGAVATAAFVPMRDGGFRYDWVDSRARAIVALGCALHALSVPTRRRGAWTRVVRGVTQGALLALLANPFDPRRRPSRAALAGTHRPGADLVSGQVGYLRALELAGALYSQQLPSTDVAGFERVWPSGYASNRYWLATDRPDGPDSAHRRTILHRFQALADKLLGPSAGRLLALSRADRRAQLRAPPAPS